MKKSEKIVLKVKQASTKWLHFKTSLLQIYLEDISIWLDAEVYIRL